MVQFGCNSNDGNFDAVASSTSINHGNYDLKTLGVPYWEGGSDHNIKLSMYLQCEAFGGLSWPVYGFDLSPTIGTLTAINRYNGISSQPQILLSAPLNLRLAATINFRERKSGNGPVGPTLLVRGKMAQGYSALNFRLVKIFL